MGLSTNQPGVAVNITCPSNISVMATGPAGTTLFYTVTASGGCTTPTIVANPPSGSTFPIGTTTVTATASDTCGNSATCSFTVTVYPQLTIACPPNITTAATGPNGATAFYNVNATGGCSPPPFVTANPPSGSTFPVGTNTVLATASDSCGNSTNCSFTVTVYPQPTIPCPSNITVAATGPSGAVVFFTVTASGGCTPPTIVANPPSGSTFPVGTTTVTVTASDTCGNTATCSFTVTVVRLTLTIQPVGSQVQVIWSIGTLQQADKVEGPYIDIDPQPTSPWTFTPSGGGKFFRVRAGQPGFTFYDTEMLQLDISGGNLPPGMRLLESPTLASTGKTAISPASGGGFVIDSFFDVFTELSTDGGGSWNPSLGAPPRMRFTGTAPSNTLPVKDASYVSPAEWHAQYAQGIYLTNASHLAFTESFPPPPPGGTTAIHSFGSTVNLLVRPCPTCPFQPVTAPAQVTVKVSSRP